MTTPAGWYLDPSDPKRERLWDGSTWTNNVRSLNAQPTPQGTPPPPQVPESATPKATSVPYPGASNTPLIATSKRRRRRWPFVLGGVLLFCAIGAYVGVRYDQSKRQDEIAVMLDLIEESEEIMYDWMTSVEPVYDEFDVNCSVTRSQENCDAFWEFTDPWLRDVSSQAATSLRAIAGEFTRSSGLHIASWHTDIVRARDSYLEHNAAWVRSLEAVSKDPYTELFGFTPNDDDIYPTWVIGCRNLRRLDTSDKNRERIEHICSDSAGDSQQQAEQAAMLGA